MRNRSFNNAVVRSYGFYSSLVEFFCVFKCPYLRQVIFLEERASDVEFNSYRVIERVRHSNVAVCLSADLDFAKVDVLERQDSRLWNVSFDRELDIIANWCRYRNFCVNFFDDVFYPAAINQLWRQLNLESFGTPSCDIKDIKSCKTFHTLGVCISPFGISRLIHQEASTNHLICYFHLLQWVDQLCIANPLDKLRRFFVLDAQRKVFWLDESRVEQNRHRLYWFSRIANHLSEHLRHNSLVTALDRFYSDRVLKSGF